MDGLMVLGLLQVPHLKQHSGLHVQDITMQPLFVEMVSLKRRLT